MIGHPAAGCLSHPLRLPSVPVEYMGPLSRFSNNNLANEPFTLLLISGPEPQRTIFEQQLLTQAIPGLGKFILVRGLPAGAQMENVPAHIIAYNHLPARELAVLIIKASSIVCRAGYSTIMDLAALNKRALLVPTPGQGEQEYLAEMLHAENLFYSVSQDRLDLEKDLRMAKTKTYAGFPGGENDLNTFLMRAGL